MPETQTPPPTAAPATTSFMDAIKATPGADALFNALPENINVPPTAPPPTPAPKAPEAPKPAAPAPTPAPPAQPRPAIPPIKPPTAPKPAAPTAPDDIPPVPDSIKSTKAAEHWAQIHSEAKTLRAQVAAQEKIIEARSKATPEVETLKTQLHEMSERLRIADVERHPQFQQYFGSRTASAIATARSAAGVDKAEEVARILQMPESDFRTEKIEAVLAELPISRQTRILSALSELDRVNVERNEAIDRAKRDGSAVDQQRQQEQQAQAAKVTQVFEATLKEAMENMPAFQERDGDDAWNAQVRQNIATARHIFGGNLSVEDRARAIIWAASAPAGWDSAAALSEEVAALKAENAALRSATPTPGGGGGENLTPEAEPANTIEAITRKMAAAGLFQGQR